MMREGRSAPTNSTAFPQPGPLSWRNGNCCYMALTCREARELAEGWVTVSDYLLTSPKDRRADIVVGNPPYIRYDDVPAEALAAYRRLYPAMIGRGDIYVGFIEAGLRQLKEGGVLGFICADRWMRSAYGSELRRMISAAFGVEVVIEMHDAPAFDNDVSAYPAVIIIRRAQQGRAIVASAGAQAGPLADGRQPRRCSHRPGPRRPGHRGRVRGDHGGALVPRYEPVAVSGTAPARACFSGWRSASARSKTR